MHTKNLFKIGSTHVLNFNYTSTVEKYITGKRLDENKIQLNYIHGKLGDKKTGLFLVSGMNST
jgi:hypothetical protein